MKKLRILLLGDLVGDTGRLVFERNINTLREELGIDATIVNGENSAHGRGITPKIVDFFKKHGVSVITSGNHIWQKKDIYPYLAQNNDLIRPANFPENSPGTGVTTFECNGFVVAVINIQGRTFMREQLACPFRTAEAIINDLRDTTNIIFVDFHAETTSEKAGLAHFLDGRITGIVGTHTHIQTADERVLPHGTAFITDLGMAGSLNSMLGMRKEEIIRNFITQMPTRFAVDTAPPYVMSGVWIDVDTHTGRAIAIERVRIIDDGN